MGVLDFKALFRSWITPYLTEIKANAGSGGGSSYVPNKIHTENWDTLQALGTTATLIKQFSQVTIQAGKKIALEIDIKTRDLAYAYGGLYLNVNCNINGLGWKNLGNTGYNGGAMMHNGYFIESNLTRRYFDFITAYSLDPNLPYTVEFELYGASYAGTNRINDAGAINTEGKGLNTRGSVENWIKPSNYSRLTIIEIDEIIDNT